MIGIGGNYGRSVQGLLSGASCRPGPEGLVEPMDSLRTPRGGGVRRGGVALVLAAIVSVLMMAIASPASATSNGAMAWGDNTFGELGNGTTTSSDLAVPVSG